ncbi:response regulator [Aequorivita todarodis]|uniref:response regulator n=1 Tax=Aequorivita todarodis TaxID=2036821 RepID=UPI0023509BA0|nr:response regulator [Aequorivita todarodis]MDC8001787.1 response regulator [Aequorivita todarodis]
MFKKVLVSEDLGSISNGIISVLEMLRIDNHKQVQYCDDAYLKIKKANLDGRPFDLLITDLSFKADHRQQQFPSGEKLIKVLKQEYPTLKIIAYSVEDRPQKIRAVMLDGKADAYVCKGRNGLRELDEAITAVLNGKTYLSPQISNALRETSTSEIEDYDIKIMQLLAQGQSQEEISQNFKEKNITPSSLSAIEKKIVKLKNQFNAKNSVQLISIAKDLGLI